MSLSRRSLLAAGTAAIGATAFGWPRASRAASSIVATTYPGSFDEAFRAIVGPAFKKTSDANVTFTPLLGVDIKTVVTNTTLMGAYRGAGRPEANYYMERLIDRAADQRNVADAAEPLPQAHRPVSGPRITALCISSARHGDLSGHDDDGLAGPRARTGRVQPSGIGPGRGRRVAISDVARQDL